MSLTQHQLDISSILFFTQSPVLYAARYTKGIARLSPTERASIKILDEVKKKY